MILTEFLSAFPFKSLHNQQCLPFRMRNEKNLDKTSCNSTMLSKITMFKVSKLSLAAELQPHLLLQCENSSPHSSSHPIITQALAGNSGGLTLAQECMGNSLSSLVLSLLTSLSSYIRTCPQTT